MKKKNSSHLFESPLPQDGFGLLTVLHILEESEQKQGYDTQVSTTFVAAGQSFSNSEFVMCKNAGAFHHVGSELIDWRMTKSCI